MASSESIQVLVVEHNHSEARRLMQMLRNAPGVKFTPQRARHFQEAQQLLEAGSINLVLLDINLPDAGGLESVLALDRIAPHTPLIVLSQKADDLLASEALAQGAQDFLVKKELTSGQLSRALLYALARQRCRSSLRNLSLVDDLTHLNNRRGFITLAEQQLKLTSRRGDGSTLVFVDLDGLKQINDTFGHSEGDLALQEIARMFRECFRESDIVARLGGDEFCALLTDATESSKDAVRRRLAKALEAHNSRPGTRYPLSVSMGVVEVGTLLALEHEIARADASMYEEKRSKQGRTSSLTGAPTSVLA